MQVALLRNIAKLVLCYVLRYVIIYKPIVEKTLLKTRNKLTRFVSSSFRPFQSVYAGFRVTRPFNRTRTTNFPANTFFDVRFTRLSPNKKLN